MKFDEKLEKVSEKPQKRVDRVLIILGLALLVASCCSYFVIDAFGQQYLQLDCPKNAYHGLDNQGNETCRDILTNQILEPESVIVVDSDSEKITSASWINDSKTGEILNDDQTLIVEIIILVGIVGVIGVGAKKRILEMFQRLGLSGIQKEQVRNRQYGKCNMCFTPPTKWKYDHIDGNKSNNDLNNCQGLCFDCYLIKTQRDIQTSIYQK
jgi:hypothetical protein